MCGIAGSVIVEDPTGSYNLTSKMLDKISHRGPDGFGFAQINSSVIGMCRLRIRSAPSVDLPFKLACGIQSSFNGEVYVTKDGRVPNGGAEEVSSITLNSKSESDGMFALANLHEDGSIVLSRDQFGIKPLFIREETGITSFASELPALISSTSPVEIDICALHEILAFGRTLDRRSIYFGIREVSPGESLRILPDGSTVIITKTPLTSELDSSSELDFTTIQSSIREALTRTLVSEMPIGLALSGGLDSSIMAHELVSLGVKNLKTFSLSVPKNSDGLTDISKLKLQRLDTSFNWKHKTILVQTEKYFQDLLTIPQQIGEPFRMSSLPLYFTLAESVKKQGVKVLLIGEGADELFGGYESYRNFISNNLQIENEIINFYLSKASIKYLHKLIGQTAILQMREKLSDLVKQLPNNLSPKQTLLSVEQFLSLEPLLRRTDHALMAYGIEGRTPFLHGNVAKIAKNINEDNLWSKKETKIALRRAYSRKLPHNIVEAPKRALRFPIDYWRTKGALELDKIHKHSQSLLSALGIHEQGVIEVRNGCSAGDPAAIPFAVFLISTVSCLSHLAINGKLANRGLSIKAAASYPFIERPRFAQ